MTETLIRSLEGRKLKLHRRLPKTESLKDCMDRTIPYFKVKRMHCPNYTVLQDEKVR
jgi:bisphosphoglycerate-dependent phosphoglycerate mutase